MKTIFLTLFLSIVGALTGVAQSDGCSAATVLNVSLNCTSPTAGTTSGATQTISGCTGNADDDVWYQFTATSNSHQITVNAASGFDPVVQLFSGACASLVSLVCKDNFGDGATETINYSNLVPGSTYRIRVYHYLTGSGTGSFDICVTEAPAPPSNDNCASAIPLTVNTSCLTTNATTNGATESSPGCAGFADDDVWFSFVATNSLQNIAVSTTNTIDLVYQVYSGSCGALTSLGCVDNTFSGQTEQQDIVGLIPGQTYYIRVYDYYQGATGDFSICVTGTPTPTPTNDEPCSAIQLPAVTATCQFSSFTTVNATASMGAPTPSSCTGGSGAAIGGFSSSSYDVWFSITVPASGSIDVTAQPNGGTGSITDGVMALYTGTCSSLTQITCSDDHTAYPGTANDFLPLISATGLTPGSIVYLRYWGFGSSSGTFGICVSTASNDDCANALYICDINGYSASTSASYTPDRPDNMRGNNEDINGVNMPDGINTGGIFGQGGPWGTGSPFFDVIINNNSWIKFTAASTTATLTVSIYDCWVGNYPSGGLQMQIFEGTNCTNFIPVSNFEESSTGFVITANGLTVGNDYYLMVDGYAGDICNYTITANSGVQFPDIADVSPICDGDSVTLEAPPGATSYEWQHNGATTQSVTVTPSTTQTYYCEVTGLCDYKQVLDVTVNVIPNPTVTILNGTTTSICNGETLALTASGATTYLWNTGQSGSTINVSPTATTNYTVTGTENGCIAETSVQVVVNANPILSVSPTSVDSDCGASNGALIGATGSGVLPISYAWSNGTSVIGTSQNLNAIPAGTYYLTITDGNSCSATFGPFNVANPGAPPAPSISTTDPSPCVGGSTQLTASSNVSGATFNWTGPNGFNSTNPVIDLNGVSTLTQGNYCVSATVSGCTGPANCAFITIDNLPVLHIQIFEDDSTICLGDSIQLSASGAASYVWSGPNNNSSTDSIWVISPSSSTDAGMYVLTGSDSNGCVASDSMWIDINELPVLTLSSGATTGAFCNGNIGTLFATGAEGYVWEAPDGSVYNGDSITIFDLAASDEGYYIVAGTDSTNCKSIDSIYLIVVTDVPTQTDGDTALCPGETLQLSASGGTDYVWTGPIGFYSESQTVIVTNDADFAHSGWYYVTVLDSNGCAGYDSTHVVIENNGDCLFIPNLITPNADGHNDLWEINGLDKFESATVDIYNRWGNLIYSISPYSEPWNGTPNKGTMLDKGDDRVPSGTYFYIIDLHDDTHPPFKGYLEVQY